MASMLRLTNYIIQSCIDFLVIGQGTSIWQAYYFILLIPLLSI
ncbi:hypothetical protein ACFOG5_06015 [Pedobacter fastidiosus]